MSDKQSKRAPGGSPALSFLLAVAKAITLLVSLLAVFIVGWSVWRWYRPEHFFNTINRFGLEQLYAARTGCRGTCLPDWHVSMLGEVFDPGEERVQIIRRLADAGYEIWCDEGDKTGYILRGAGTGHCSCATVTSLSI